MTQHLPPKITQADNVCEPTYDAPAVDQMEMTRLIRILRQTGGNQSEAARLPGVSRATLWKRIKKTALIFLPTLPDPQRVGALRYSGNRPQRSDLIFLDS